jgi:hypothetical protein
MDQTKKSILCDGCQKELVRESKYPHNYGLVLKSVDFELPTPEGLATFTVAMYPKIDRDCHFCGPGCLMSWCREEGI